MFVDVLCFFGCVLLCVEIVLFGSGVLYYIIIFRVCYVPRGEEKNKNRTKQKARIWSRVLEMMITEHQRLRLGTGRGGEGGAELGLVS